MDCKKDKAGKIEGAACKATPESLPDLDFCKTRKDKSGFLAVPSLNSPIVKFTVPSPLEPLTARDRDEPSNNPIWKKTQEGTKQNYSARPKRKKCKGRRETAVPRSSPTNWLAAA